MWCWTRNASDDNITTENQYEDIADIADIAGREELKQMVREKKQEKTAVIDIEGSVVINQMPR